MQDQEKTLRMQQLVEEFHRSNKSQRAFAQDNNINYYTFRYWVYKFRRQQQDHPGFIQINPSPENQRSLCVRYPGGIELYLPVHTPAKTILQLIRG